VWPWNLVLANFTGPRDIEPILLDFQRRVGPDAEPLGSGETMPGCSENFRLGGPLTEFFLDRGSPLFWGLLTPKSKLIVCDKSFLMFGPIALSFRFPSGPPRPATLNFCNFI
jgi:hypothetical protein